MDKKKIVDLQDLKEDVQLSTPSEAETIEEAIREGIDKMNAIIDMGYSIDYFKVVPESVDDIETEKERWHFSIEIEGTK